MIGVNCRFQGSLLSSHQVKLTKTCGVETILMLALVKRLLVSTQHLLVLVGIH